MVTSGRMPLYSSKLKRMVAQVLGTSGTNDKSDQSPRPELGQAGLTGDARFAAQITNVSFDPKHRQWVLAHRLDRVRYQDYDRVRFYPTVIDALNSILLPIERANFHFECAYQPAADLAMQELGPHIRNLIKQLARGGLQFGRQTAEKVWVCKTNVSVSSTQSDTGMVNRIYPFIWTLKRFAFFSPDDTDILIWPRIGEFAGLRQYMSVMDMEDRDIPASKLIHFIHNQEFDSNYGVPRTKASIPFVDLAQQLYNDASIYFNRFAVPTIIGYAPPGKREAGNNPDGSPNVVDNKVWLRDQIKGLKNASGLILSNELLADGKSRAWEIQPLEIGERGMFVEYALHLNVMIGASLCVPQMAMSSVPSSGTYNLGETQIGEFTQNEEALLDALKDSSNEQLVNEFRIVNFGHGCPPLRLVFEPVSTDVARMFLQALVQNLAMGVPIYADDNEQIIVDWSKLCSDYGAPTRKVKVMQPQQGQGQPGMPPGASQGDPDGQGAPQQAQAQTSDDSGIEGEGGGGGHGKTGGSLVAKEGDKEAANDLPGSRGGMEGAAKGQKDRARMGLSEDSGYVALSEKILKELELMSRIEVIN